MILTKLINLRKICFRHLLHEILHGSNTAFRPVLASFVFPIVTHQVAIVPITWSTWNIT